MDTTIPSIDTASISRDSGFRFIPTPEKSGVFNSILGVARSALSLVPGASRSIGFTDPSGISPDFQSLIELQLQAQKEMMLVSMVSNVEKSKHETQMAPVRNIRVG